MGFARDIKPEKIKAENTSMLRADGMEVPDHLPPLAAPAFREPEQVAKRMMVLMALFYLQLGAPNKMIIKWLEDNELLDSLTAEETEILQSNFKDLPEQIQADIQWYVEAIWAFAWVGGLHNKLTFTTHVEDSLASMTPSIKTNESAKPFIRNFRLRSQLEIFDKLDKFYRAHWFARNKRLQGQKSDKVDLDLILERRKALEYTCYTQCEWDSISLDT